MQSSFACTWNRIMTAWNLIMCWLIINELVVIAFQEAAIARNKR